MNCNLLGLGSHKRLTDFYSPKMRISKEISVNVNCAEYSFCGNYLAFGFINELTVVRVFDKVTVFNVFCSSNIKSIEWSPANSDHILCLISNKNCVEVFSLSSPGWICIIREGPAGLSKAVWSPEGTHIVTVAEFALRLSVWSLIGRSVAFIENPLMKPQEKFTFSADQKRFAVATGEFNRFQISIFSTLSWTVVTRIHCTNVINVPSSPLWSFNGSYIAIWETDDYEKSVLEIYDVKTRKKLSQFGILNNNKLGGICSVIWSQNSQFLLIGCFDDCIYILNYITWNVTSVFSHKTVINDSNCQILLQGDNAMDSKFITLHERPAKFTFIAPFHGIMPGIKNISLSKDGIHVVSQSRLLPAVVWIWNLDTLSLTTVVVFKNKVTSLQWSYWSLDLLMCDGSNTVTFWSQNRISRINLDSCHLNHQWKIKKGRWCPHPISKSKTLLLYTSASVIIVSNFDKYYNHTNSLICCRKHYEQLHSYIIRL